MRHYLFMKDGFESLSGKQKDLARLEWECEQLFAQNLPAEHPKKSTTYMGMAIFNLALCYRVTKKSRYLEEAQRWIRTVLGYEKWGNAHLVNLDLSAAWILFGLSVGYDWLKEDLDMDLRERTGEKILHHARIIYEYASTTRDRSWPIEYWQNHNWIDHTGLAAAGYALKGEYAEADEFIRFSRDNFTKVYSLLASDGSDYEGVVYWRYGAMWLFVYAWLFYTEEGDDTFFRECGFLKNTVMFRIYQGSASLFRHVGFGDAHDRLSSNPVCVYYLVARMYRDGYAQKLGNLVRDTFLETERNESKVKPGLSAEAGFELIWHSDTPEKEFSTLPLSKYFPDLGLVTLRSSWERDAKVFTFKCAAPGGWKQFRAGLEYERQGIKVFGLSHHHPDNQSYVLLKGEDYFITEDGYNRNILPGEHSNFLVDGRYTDAENCNDVYASSLRMRMEKNPEYPAENYCGYIKDIRMENRVVLLSSRNEGIYPESLKMDRVARVVFSDGVDFVLFFDVLESEVEHEYTVVLNSDEDPVEDNGVLRFPSHGVDYLLLSDEKMDRHSEPVHIKAVMTTQEPDKFVEVFIRSLRHTSRKLKSLRAFEVLSYSDSKLAVVYEKDELAIRTDKGIYRFNAGQKFSVTLPSGESLSVDY